MPSVWIITKLLLPLPFDDLCVLEQWNECLPVEGLQHLARERFKNEESSSRLLKLIVVAESIRDKIKKLAYRENAKEVSSATSEIDEHHHGLAHQEGGQQDVARLLHPADEGEPQHV